jgi:hypothetical protein
MSLPVVGSEISSKVETCSDSELPQSSPECNIHSTMPNHLPITDLLRKTINESGVPFLTLEQKTGVLRQSLMKFARGDTSIHLDSADQVARFYGLELRPVAKKATKRTKGQSSPRKDDQ